ncbi:branched-chain amino acid ABC transporter permease [candidate division KSB3 bacterium]|uniref:Branched-chain amino acid ABC transporter permease n=1 Tax=candidate division KSB3 bacterium TaxID=2044937 RepID=A0A9D5JZN9_9BACT|nr:branched-chain amino acid ABC transporter permease [candidate division KSB3 bacterium]MBD3326931.1 branched-chain amino acid ABC transporter permease [candidate division KSB3 bacterium]
MIFYKWLRRFALARGHGGEGWLRGAVQASPIMMGYLPVGLAFGVLAQNAGISPLNTVLMSLLVYAGASQFIAVGLLAGGVPPVSIILTTFIVNLRHLIMASALAPALKGWRRRELAAFAFHLTDETFAVHATNFAAENPPKPQVFATNVTAYASWTGGTSLGIVLGQRVTDVQPFALDFALPALFIVLLVLQVTTRLHVLVAGIAGIGAVGLLQAGLEHWNVMLATVVGATIGVCLEQWNKARSS